MKKTVSVASALLALLSLGACSSADKKACQKSDMPDQVFTGVVPAADCDGVRYTLHLDYDDAGNDGDYLLVETYIEADTTAMTGFRDVRSFKSKGDFTVNSRDGKKFLKLVPDAAKDQASSLDVSYFMVDSDSTVTMTNEALDVSATPGMNYTLKLAH